MNMQVMKGLLVIGAVILLAGLGCRQLTTRIYASMDCNQFNIDHIELRTGIDIPSVLGSDCSLDADVRKVRFELSRGVDMDRYAGRNAFIDLEGSWLTRSGSTNDTQWSARLDTNAFALEFELTYMD